MMATRNGNALHPDIAKELKGIPQKRGEWEVSAKKKRLGPCILFSYPDPDCYSVDFIVTTYTGKWIP